MHKTLPIRRFVNTGTTPSVADVGTAGTTSRSYKLVGLDADGSHSAAGAAGNSATGVDTLNSTDKERITWTDPVGAVSVQIWRTVPSGPKGLIGTVAAGVQTFDDIGQTPSVVGDPPSTNTTGIGDPVSVGDMEEVYLQASGTFTATVQVQGSIAPGAWMDEGAAITAVSAAPVQVAESYEQLRVKMTAFTSGTPVVTVGGHPDR